MAKKVRWLFDVDIVGRCNLRCPSCPVGNSAEAPELRLIDRAGRHRAIPLEENGPPGFTETPRLD